MTTRIHQPDTAADIALRAYLDRDDPANFIMVAGAGSGKTTSLVKGLAHLASSRGGRFRQRGQKIACITYTDVAVREIWGDVGNDPLFHVSTIHSFLWTIVRSFQSDLKAWVLTRLIEKADEARERLANPRTRAATRPRLEREIERYAEQAAAVTALSRFTYGTGSDYARGVLGHSDILSLAPALLEANDLLRTVLAAKFPFVFVDESQDTVPAVVAALRRVAEAGAERFCLAFFGDPMQKIYTTGSGAIVPEPDWGEITKPENFRCPQSVLRVINAIRAEDDGLQQVRGRTIDVDGVELPVEGTARLFLMPADDRRSEHLATVRTWLARTNDDPLWVADDREADVRALVLVHRMAATRLGFPNLYAALNDRAPSSLKDGLDDGTSWPLRPFLGFILPIVLAARDERQFDVISILRKECPLLSRDELPGRDTAALLRQLSGDVTALVAQLDMGSGNSILDVLCFVRERQLFELDERYVPYLDNPEIPVDEEGDPEASSMNAFLACPTNELWGYRHYLEDLSPFSTQQGVKGAEFQRVLVVIDDEEARAQTQISYGKYFGITPLSETDEQNIAGGLDSVLGRTRRLFYVCCSRAVQDLAVVMFLPDVAAVRDRIERRGYFQPGDILDIAALRPDV